METYDELIATAKAARANAAIVLKYAAFLEERAAKLVPAPETKKRMSESAKAGWVIRKRKAAQHPRAGDGFAEGESSEAEI